jgi:hypothetical protein
MQLIQKKPPSCTPAASMDFNYIMVHLLGVNFKLYIKESSGIMLISAILFQLDTESLQSNTADITVTGIDGWKCHDQ